MSLVPNVQEEDYRTGASRGGRDRFKWEDVKSDTYRENYIGHSLKAPVGRWENSRDFLWWTKNGNDNKNHSDNESSDEKRTKKKSKKRHREERGKDKKERRKKKKTTGIQDEKSRLKHIESQLMADALGSGFMLRPENSKLELGADFDPQLEESELKQVIAATRVDRTADTGERIKGLGMGTSRKHDFVDLRIRSNIKIKKEKDTANEDNDSSRAMKREVALRSEQEAEAVISDPEKHRKKERKERRRLEKKRLKKLLKESKKRFR